MLIAVDREKERKVRIHMQLQHALFIVLLLKN